MHAGDAACITLVLAATAPRGVAALARDRKGLAVAAANEQEEHMARVKKAENNDATEQAGDGDSAAAAAAAGVIAIPALQIQRIKLRLRGRTPLICHSWDPKTIRQIEEKQQKKARAAKAAKDPEAEWNAARYRDEQGRDCVLCRGIKRAIVNAARFNEDTKMTLLRGALFVIGDSVPIHYEGKEPERRRDMVRVGMGTADVRYRPAYNRWHLDIEIEYNSRVVSAEQVVDLVRLAGFSVGLCEWRPEKNGDFGRFDVEAMPQLPAAAE